MRADSDALINILKEIDAMTIRDVVASPDDGGLSIYAMDPAKTTIVVGKVKSAAFPDGCPFTQDTVLSIPFMLDALVKGKECDISIDDGIISIKYGKSKRTRRLIEPESGPRPVPNLELTDKCILMSDDIVNVIKMSCFQDIKSDNDGISVSLLPEGVSFAVRSDVESADMFVEGTTDLTQDDQTAIFGLKVLIPILKSLPKSTMVTFSMATNMPIRIDVDEDTYSMIIYIAPYIPQE